MSKPAITFALLVLLSATGLAQGGRPRGDAPVLRTLEGKVLGNGDAPLADSIVYLKNTKTMAVRTFIAEKDGGYRFTALSPTIDYEVFAEYKGKKSDTKTVSSFDTRRVSTIILKINANP